MLIKVCTYSMDFLQHTLDYMNSAKQERIVRGIPLVMKLVQVELAPARNIGITTVDKTQWAH